MNEGVRSLPPANEVWEGYVFTRVCPSVHRGEEGTRPTPRGEVEGLGTHPGEVSRSRPRGEVEGSGTHRGEVSRSRPRSGVNISCK